jgi:Ni/Fe-hydrogenase 1 B-type cytochrome subunit
MTAVVEPVATPVPPPAPAPGAAAHAPGAAHRAPGVEERFRLYIWQLPVRLTHWVTAGCIVVLSVTGVYIADPFLIPPGGAVMTTIRQVHMLAAFTLLGAGLLRAIWLLAGNRFARWSAFFPTTRVQLTEIFRQAAFYAFIRKEIPRILGHNQLAASAYILLWALLILETLTGFALDGLLGSEPGATGFGWVIGVVGPQLVRLVHHLAMWGILAISLFHIYSCVLVDHLEKNGLLSSIFSGFKYVSREEIIEARDGGAELLETVE